MCGIVIWGIEHRVMLGTEKVQVQNKLVRSVDVISWGAEAKERESQDLSSSSKHRSTHKELHTLHVDLRLFQSDRKFRWTRWALSDFRSVSK
ncbi:hypothetical protein R1flu_028103 [Riccia fluitans]|uniref:Uncharacterized protein n=1 Tax=Riccia fluitans TaxID=41844 RepID=A0ABD1XKQ2_9MARC